jgi:hypothetical protein
MALPKVYTFIIHSAARALGTAADYYVKLPQLDALSAGPGRPDYYDLYLDKISGTYIAQDSAVTSELLGAVQIALDFTSPYKTSTTNPNIMFVVPIESTANGYLMDPNSRTMNPIVVSASGMNSMLHVQLFNDSYPAKIVDPGGHEHIIVLTLRERFPMVFKNA